VSAGEEVIGGHVLGSTDTEDNLSLIYEDTTKFEIEQAGLNPAAIIPFSIVNTTAHEMAHEWWVNAPQNLSQGGHCFHSEWLSSNRCLMHSFAGVNDDFLFRRFHSFKETFNDLLCMRYRGEDFNDDEDTCVIP
jgi:hypothetical protein